MNRIEELNNLPENIKREVLDFAEYLLLKYDSKNKKTEIKWADVRGRGRSMGETAGETVIRIRGDEKW